MCPFHKCIPLILPLISMDLMEIKSIQNSIINTLCLEYGETTDRATSCSTACSKCKFQSRCLYPKRKKNLVPHLKTEKTLRSPLYPQLYILNMYCTQCYLTNHTGQLSHTGKERAVKAPHTDWIPILCTFFTVMS